MNLFVRDLTVIDSSFICEHRGIVGESWILDVSMSGELNEMSMVLDFGRVKKQIKQLVDEHFDHKLLVPMQNSAVIYQASKAGYSTLDLMRADKSLHLHCPDEAFCLIDAKAITIESITKQIQQMLREHLPSNVTGIEITLRYETIAGAFYHYSHGLKKHDGNCQRIAHGHRSPIEILVDGKRDLHREQALAADWQDIYLGSQEDLAALDALDLSHHADNITAETHFGFCYTAPQGQFQLAIAKADTEIIATDTTVELLAEHIANQVETTLNKDQTLQVIAYEGVGKGAIAFR